MKYWLTRAALCGSLAGALVAGVSEATPRARGPVTLEEITVNVPETWRVGQEALSDDTLILGLSSGSASLTFYVKKQTGMNVEDIFVNGSQVTRGAESETHGEFTWTVLETSKKKPSGLTGSFYMKAFYQELGGNTYYGYSRADSQSAAAETAATFLDALTKKQGRVRNARSLTGQGYSGKKYYLGWGRAMPQDPKLMHNEVTYDVYHTHDIFTEKIGGEYQGNALFGQQAGSSAIKQAWNDIKSGMTSDDMYVQYSSGHGSTQGLEVGVSYNEMRDAVLAMPAKELIVFTMACHSGGLVKAFEAKKSVWQNWGEEGRTLMVLASSRHSESSATGPSNDPDEPNGPKGSGGSAFGHALWKALGGYSDGYVDGVMDGFISLGEIEHFTIAKTKKVGGHTPVITGVYDPMLIMNRVPPDSFRKKWEGGTDGLTEEQLEVKIRELDRLMRVHSL